MTFPGTARYAAALAVIFGSLMVATGTAQAGVASVDGPVVSFEAQHGEVNDVRANPSPDGVLFTDSSTPIQAGGGCSAQSDGVFCAFPGSISDGRIVELHLRDRDDTAEFDDVGLGSVTDQRVFGGRGDDTITGGTRTLLLEHGGPGNDALTSANNFGGITTQKGGPGRDLLSAIETAEIHMDGGANADTLRIPDGLAFPPADHSFNGGTGNDRIDFSDGGDGGFLAEVTAGRGFDTVSFENVFTQSGVDLDFNTCPACNVERVIGTPFNDTLIGDGSWMRFDGGAGDDAIDPGAGFDTVFAGDGSDQVNVAGDRAFDLASCGADEDTAVADRRDLIFGDCETVTRGAGRSATPW